MNYIARACVYPELERGEICLINAPDADEARKNYAAALDAGALPLLLTSGPLADSDKLKKLLSGMNGAGVCWDIAQPLSAGEPPRTTVKAIGRFIRAVQLTAPEQLPSLELLKAQGFDGVVICPPGLTL